MSEVKRYMEFCGVAEHAEGGFVEFKDFDAQRLRADTAEACLEEWRRSNHGNTVLENMDLREKLADAEQRNVDLLGLLRDTKTMLASELSYELYHNIAVHMKRIDAALNPSPEAESHEKH